MPDRLPITRLHHVARLTKRLDECRAFYQNVLGFREIERPGLKFDGAWLYAEGLQIHLIVDASAAGDRGPISTRDHHLAFHAPDLEHFESRLREHGNKYSENEQAQT